MSNPIKFPGSVASVVIKASLERQSLHLEDRLVMVDLCTDSLGDVETRFGDGDAMELHHHVRVEGDGQGLAGDV